MTLEFPVAQARFRRPPTPSDLTPRARLIERLNQVPRFPLTVVAAPAGMGKTCLLSAWLDDSGLPYVWLTLNGGDARPEVFVRTFITAIRTRYLEFGRSTLTALNGLTLPSPEVLAADIAMELLRLGEELVIVLDDYELIQDPATHQFVRELVPLLPSLVHLVICSRIVPPLPLARLRAQGQVLDISTDDLRFGSQEAQSVLEQAAGRPLAPDLVETVESQTEGWPFALRLIGLALRGDAQPEAVIAALGAPSRGQIITFLLEEIYSQQPAPMQDMLLKTSILEHLTPSLCEAVAGDDTAELTGQAFIDWLESTNLLAAPTDVVGWSRCHGLLRLALQYRMWTSWKIRDIKVLHARAARWFAENGAVDQAIPHYLAAEQPLAAVRLVEANVLSLVASEDRLRLEHWLDLLPADQVASNPLLLCCQAWFVFLRQGFAFLSPLFQKIEALLQEPDGVNSTWPKAAVEAMLAAVAAPFEWSAGDVERALNRARRARLAVDASYAPLDGWAVFHEAMALHLFGQHDDALDLLDTALADGTRRNEPLMVGRALYGFALVHWLSGDLGAMEHAARQMLQVHLKGGRRIGSGWANFLLGALYYEWNQLDKARHHFDDVLAYRHEVNHRILPDTVFLAAQVSDLEGRTEAADALLDGLENLAWDTTNLSTLRLVASFRAQRAARWGDLAAAERWLAEAKPGPETGPMIFPEVPGLTHARVLLAKGTKTSARQALEHLDHLEKIARSFSHTRRLIEILAVSAVAHSRLGLRTEALSRLEEAVRLGEPGRFTRTFLDLGPDMARLLGELARQKDAGDYVPYLLHQFAINPAIDLATDRVAVRRQQAQSQLIEPLTAREIEVLELLVQRHTYQEIAQRLVISRATVRAHVIHIYQKLNVSSRSEAIVATQRLGLMVDG